MIAVCWLIYAKVSGLVRLIPERRCRRCDKVHDFPDYCNGE